jgi:hypothetical protein
MITPLLIIVELFVIVPALSSVPSLVSSEKYGVPASISSNPSGMESESPLDIWKSDITKHLFVPLKSHSPP